jgi:hypothetical protein
MAAYGVAAMPLGFILYDSSLYLHARFNWSQSTLGYVLWIPPFGWEVGYFFWGFVVDRLGPRFRSLMLASMVLSLPLAWMQSLATGPLVLGDMFLSMFGLAGFVVLSVGYATRAFPPGHSGLLAGIGAGSWGAIVALMMPVFGRLFHRPCRRGVGRKFRETARLRRLDRQCSRHQPHAASWRRCRDHRTVEPQRRFENRQQGPHSHLRSEATGRIFLCQADHGEPGETRIPAAGHSGRDEAPHAVL